MGRNVKLSEVLLFGKRSYVLKDEISTLPIQLTFIDKFSTENNVLFCETKLDASNTCYLTSDQITSGYKLYFSKSELYDYVLKNIHQARLFPDDVIPYPTDLI